MERVLKLIVLLCLLLSHRHDFVDAVQGHFNIEGVDYWKYGKENLDIAADFASNMSFKYINQTYPPCWEFECEGSADCRKVQAIQLEDFWKPYPKNNTIDDKIIDGCVKATTKTLEDNAGWKSYCFCFFTMCRLKNGAPSYLKGGITKGIEEQNKVYGKKVKTLPGETCDAYFTTRNLIQDEHVMTLITCGTGTCELETHQNLENKTCTDQLLAKKSQRECVACMLWNDDYILKTKCVRAKDYARSLQANCGANDEIQPKLLNCCREDNCNHLEHKDTLTGLNTDTGQESFVFLHEIDKTTKPPEDEGAYGQLTYHRKKKKKPVEQGTPSPGKKAPVETAYDYEYFGDAYYYYPSKLWMLELVQGESNLLAPNNSSATEKAASHSLLALMVLLMVAASNYLFTI